MDAIAGRWQKDKSLITTWIEMGSRNGDLYRQYLINPIIHGLLISSKWKTSPSPIHEALASWHDTYCKAEADLGSLAWYRVWQETTVNANSILDLGCGEAYRGRWLSKDSIVYVGVDVSKPLLARAIEQNKFRCVVRDLDTPSPLRDIWQQTVPPEWVLAITLLDQLEHPEWLLADIAALYGTGHRGRMLVVTCNPEFYGHSGEGDQPLDARIATVDGKGGDGVAYLRSRQAIRKLFRDAGMHVLDEASPPLPALLASKRQFEAGSLNLAHSPFVVWLVEIHSTRRDPASSPQVRKWLDELTTDSREFEAVRALLQQLEPEAAQLSWRRFRKGNVAVRRHNLGGRLFVVRHGSFEVDFLNGQSGDGTEKGARRRWNFRANQVFGELEVEHEAEQRERLYTASVFVDQEEVSKGHAEALEVPAQVTRDLMRASSLLGNPFFNLLRRKVLDGLMRFDPNALDDKMKVEKEMERVLGRQKTPKDLMDLKASAVVVVASLLLQGLEADRERGIVRDPRIRVVLVAHMRNSISEIVGKKLDQKDMNRFNRAIRFLSAAGVLRVMKPVVTDAVDSDSSSTGTQRNSFANRFKAQLVQEEWYQHLDNDPKYALNRLMAAQTACLFMVDDEIALRRCLLESSLELIEDLAKRRRIFTPQPKDIEGARDADLAKAVTHALHARFASDHWRSDSLGLPIGDE